MKKIVVLSSVLLFISILLLVSIFNREKIYGYYVYDNIVYQSPSSPVSRDFLLKQIDNTKITIKSNIFKIEDSRNKFEIKNVKYIKKKVDIDMVNKFNKAVMNTVELLDEIKYQYTILNSLNNTANFLLFQTDNNIWLVSIIDKENNDYEFMYIYKIKKIK